MKQILRVHEINPFRTVKYIIDDWKLIRVIRLMGLMVAYKGGYWTNKFPRDRMYLSKILSAMRQYQQDCGLILLILLVLIYSRARARNYDYIYLDLRSFTTDISPSTITIFTSVMRDGIYT